MPTYDEMREKLLKSEKKYPLLITMEALPGMPEKYAVIPMKGSGHIRITNEQKKYIELHKKLPPDLSPVAKIARAETARAETARAEIASAETASAETARAEIASAETASAETARVKTASAETASAETPRGKFATLKPSFKMFSSVVDKLSVLNAQEMRMLLIIKNTMLEANNETVCISREQFISQGLQGKFIADSAQKLSEINLIRLSDGKNKSNRSVKFYSIIDIYY